MEISKKPASASPRRSFGNTKSASDKNFGAFGQNSKMTSEAEENIIIQWFVWHFYEMTKFLFSVWKNYIEFGLEFFSVPLLFSTLLSPWKKYNWRYPKSFSIIEFLNTLFSNIFSRIIGALIRLVLIVFGMVAQIFILITGFIIILLWLLLPIMMLMLMLLLP